MAVLRKSSSLYVVFKLLDIIRYLIYLGSFYTRFKDENTWTSFWLFSLVEKKLNSYCAFISKAAFRLLQYKNIKIFIKHLREPQKKSKIKLIKNHYFAEKLNKIWSLI